MGLKDDHLPPRRSNGFLEATDIVVDFPCAIELWSSVGTVRKASWFAGVKGILEEG